MIGKIAKKFPSSPRHPERICWGCDRYCPANDMACGNGSVRCMHPLECGEVIDINAGSIKAKRYMKKNDK